MKLLFDQNISFRIVNRLKDIFQDCAQVRNEGLENATDIEIWDYAKREGFNIVTFDTDFYDLSTLKGHPPKVIWLRIGNTSTENLEKVLRENEEIIKEFLSSETYSEISCLEIQ